MCPEHIESAAGEVAGEDFIPDEIPDRLQDDCLINHFRLRFDDREEYLSKLRNTTGTDDHKKMEKEAHRIEKELARIEETRSSFASAPENKISMWKFEYSRANWKNHAQKASADNLKSVEDRVSKMELETAHSRRIDLERQILKKVERWPPTAIPPEPKDSEQTTLEKKKTEPKIMKGRLLRACGKKKDAEEEPKKKKKQKKPVPEKKERPRPSDSYGLTINQITLQRSDSVCPLSYMSYGMKKRSLYNCLFKEENNPLHKDKHEPNTIRYFHIPANNMLWIEEAIARYYGETTPGEYNYRQAKNYMKKSSDLLCREFWTSLQHGGTYDPVHARHMRAHCSRINPETKCANGGSTNNFIIFMPYLHWESHKRRKKMAEETKKVTDKHLETRSHDTEDLKAEFIKLCEQIKIKHARGLTGFGNTDEPKRNQKDEKDPKKSLKPRLLGQYLLHIAKLYDSMDVEPDVRILRDYLFQNPPLHVRRTLDQSYYWKLPNTDGRDQDQVVYRETQEGKHLSRTTRVVMVDQLWMYILDDNTIITSFPRRWGRNKPDHSGVHRGIRARLDHLKAGQVQSVYDLALLIMNQCSTVFFDLTKPIDERPEVLDIFSNALSHVSGMKTVAYETFWRHLDKLNATDRQLADFEITARSYLNINPEGELLKEAHDIIEELRMMALIYTQQLHVLEDFSRHLENMHQADEKRSPKELLDVMVEIKNLLGTRNAPHSAEDPILNAQHNHSPIQNGAAVLHGMPLENNTATNASSISESTVEFAKRVCNNITLRRKELQNLEENSIAVSDQLRDLLSLKQQQASIIEAKLALKRADESVIQGRSIMLFTIVTIIFLPLSFMTSVFGMNAKEFDGPGGGNSMSLKQQFKLIFPISVGVIVVSISLAFSPWIRSIIGFFTHITFATIIEYTYIRRIWLWCVRKHTPDGLYETKQDIVGKIYSRKEREDARRQRDQAVMVERKDKGWKEEDDWWCFGRSDDGGKVSPV